jgi:hypothetical protein
MSDKTRRESGGGLGGRRHPEDCPEVTIELLPRILSGG